MIDLSKVIISSMSIRDLDEIKDSLQEKFSNLWSYEIFKDELEHNNSDFLVLRYDNEIVCYGGIKTILDEAELMDIVTRIDLRRSRFSKNSS